MDQKYQEWIDAKLKSGDDPFTKCAEWTLEMQAAFPELIRVRGQVMLSNLWERDHWWLKTPTGEIVDPTKAQFAQEYYSGGATVLWYQERDESEPEPTGMCANCGGLIYGGRDTVCSDSCARAYCAYLGVGWGGDK